MQAASAHAWKGDVEVMGQAGRCGAVAFHARELCFESVPELIPQLRKPGVAFVSIRHRLLYGRRKAHDQGAGQRAGAKACLLTTPPLQGLQLDPFADDQGADAFGAIELVSAEADEIKPQVVRFERDVSKGLRCIAVKDDPAVSADLCEFLQGLQDADFIVGGHDAHQTRVRPDRFLKLGWRDQAIGLGLEQRNLESFPLQLAEGIQHSVVFRIHADQMSATVGSGMAQQGQIVGFGGAAGEDQSTRIDAEGLCDLATGQGNGGRCGKALAMLTARGIAPMVRPIGRHRFHHLR